MSWRLMPASALAQQRARWDTLHRSGPALALLHYDFVAPLLTHFGSGRELLACYERDGRTLAMAIVTPAGRAAWQTFQPSQAPLGIWLQAPDADREALLASLIGALPGFPLIFGLTQCDPDLMARPRDGGAQATSDYQDTARITLGGSFADYWEGRGKNLRANLKKQRARLARDGVSARMEVLRDPASMAAAVDGYGRMESSGWKQQAGTAVHADNPQGRYYREMLEAFCARGAGAVYRYWFGEQLVATDLCIEDAHCLIVLKTTYDEAVAQGLSPTLLMREEACRALFDEGRFARIEFYGKVMPWHLRWTDEVRTQYHLNYYRWPLLRRAHAAVRARRSHAASSHPHIEAEP